MSTPMQDQLPAFMGADPFLSRFLRIFEEVHGTVTAHGDQLEHLLDVSVAPPEFVRWMGGWLGVQVEASLSEERQRHIVTEAARLFGLRGTKEGLQGLLTVLTGGVVTVEDGCGVHLEDDAPANPKLVTLRMETAGEYTVETLERVIVQELPADVDYELYIEGLLIVYTNRIGSAVHVGTHISHLEPEGGDG